MVKQHVIIQMQPMHNIAEIIFLNQLLHLLLGRIHRAQT